MSPSDTDALLANLKSLPPRRLLEVEDFIDFLRSREDEHRWTVSASAASIASFAKVLENDADADYDHLQFRWRRPGTVSVHRPIKRQAAARERD